MANQKLEKTDKRVEGLSKMTEHLSVQHSALNKLLKELEREEKLMLIKSKKSI